MLWTPSCTIAYYPWLSGKSEDCLEKEIIQGTILDEELKEDVKLDGMIIYSRGLNCNSTGYWKRQETEVDRVKLFW